MRLDRNGNNWCYNAGFKEENTMPGVVRKILSFCDEAMCVENSFKTGAVGILHHHPHTQITYIAKGVFSFIIGNETKIVREGDALLMQNGIIHGCECLEEGILIDFFTPMREDFC